MKKLTISFENISHIEDKTVTVKSEAAMWNALRTARDILSDEDLAAGARATVTTEDGTLFKDITFRRNSKGKIEMPNSVKETCRCRVTKAKKAAAKLEEKKAKKRETDRRYRERKKAAKAAAAHEKLLAEGSIAAAEDPDTGINC